MRLYHTGFDIIKVPDLGRGRRNADFGPGFYLSPDGEFSRRWARERSGVTTYVNEYELDMEGLDVKVLDRDVQWFDLIYGNRNRVHDGLSAYDVVIGPIANDTIYDVMGVTTSGFLEREQALSLLTIGPIYTQVVIKSPKAASQLKWLGAEELSVEEIKSYRSLVNIEEDSFQTLFAERLSEFVNL
ncbi:MAG: DUF3990 domain-containing protein [Spirochaetales bacterium]|nr:DUF3990 domain-containing protein [Spirochaetales bacterium]